jgi:hypothetical protein
MSGAMSYLRICCLIAAIALSLNWDIRCAKSQSASSSGDDYSTRIEPIFISRGVACHSCYNAPCQLNLQSYSGLARGATAERLCRSRPKSVSPSRLDVDGHGVSDWRAKGFFDVVGDIKPARTVLMQLLALRAGHPAVQPRKAVEESNFCPADSDQATLISKTTPELG